MKKYILIIIILPIVISCQKKCDDEEGLLTSEELSWLSYAGGETLIFKSNNNQYDTLHASEIVTYNTPISGASSGSCRPKQESKACRINSDVVLMDLHTYHKNEWSPNGKAYIMTSVSVFNFLDYTPQNNILINGNTYNDVYIMDVDTSSFSSKHIWRIYYTKQNGILGYNLTQGEQWEKIN